MDVNERQKYFYIDKIISYFRGSIKGKIFACLGAAFKANTDDVRKSVSLEIIKVLRGEGAKIRLYDPKAMKNAKKELGNDVIYYAENALDAIKGSDALCILTEWSEFSSLDLKKIKNSLKDRVIFDGRNLLDSSKVRKEGLTYFGIGKN